MKTKPEPETHSRTGNEKEQSEKTKIKKESCSVSNPQMPSQALSFLMQSWAVLSWKLLTVGGRWWKCGGREKQSQVMLSLEKLPTTFNTLFLITIRRWLKSSQYNAHDNSELRVFVEDVNGTDHMTIFV